MASGSLYISDGGCKTGPLGLSVLPHPEANIPTPLSTLVPPEVLADVSAISLRVVLFCFAFCISISNYGKLPVCPMLEFQSLSEKFSRASGVFGDTLQSTPNADTSPRSQALSKENVVILPTKLKPEN